MTHQESVDLSAVTIFKRFPDWPLGQNWVAANSTISYSAKQKLSAVERAAYRVLQTSRFGDKDSPMEVGLMAYIARFFFTSATLYPFILYIQLNTGWNLEVVQSITTNLDDHIAPDLLDPDYVVIWGWKNRTEKTQSHRVNTKTPYGVYAVLKFVSDIVSSIPDREGERLQSLWQYVPSKNQWPKCNAVRQELFGTNIAIEAPRVSRRPVGLSQAVTA